MNNGDGIAGDLARITQPGPPSWPNYTTGSRPRPSAMVCSTSRIAPSTAQSGR